MNYIAVIKIWCWTAYIFSGFSQLHYFQRDAYKVDHRINWKLQFIWFFFHSRCRHMQAKTSYNGRSIVQYHIRKKRQKGKAQKQLHIINSVENSREKLAFRLLLFIGVRFKRLNNKYNYRLQWKNKLQNQMQICVCNPFFVCSRGRPVLVAIFINKNCIRFIFDIDFARARSALFAYCCIYCHFHWVVMTM